jgi:glycosyltransferase involved in cell wall biosynthesis
MHIALVNRWYPPHTGYGGVAVYNYYLAHALVKLGHRVTIIAARWSEDVRALDDDNGVTVHRLLAPDHYRLRRLPLLKRYVRPLQQLLYSRKVARKLHQIDQPDVVEFAEVNAEGFAYLRQSHQAGVVVRCHTPTFVLRNYYQAHEMDYDTTLTLAMEKFCIRRADTLTAPSQDMARTITRACRLSENSIAVIPNALDVDLFVPPKHRPATERNELTIIHVGRLDRAKGIEILAQAIPAVIKKFPQTRFIFVGEDRPDGRGSTWQQRLTTLFKQGGVDNHVVFTGGVDQPTLIDRYHQADMAVIPSILYESFSYTCAQAMAAGLPVVAARIGGIPETVDNEVSGLLVTPNHSAELAQAITRLAQDPALRAQMGRAGQQRAKQQFSADLVAGQVLKIYQSTQS